MYSIYIKNILKLIYKSFQVGLEGFYMLKWISIVFTTLILNLIIF